MRSLTELWQSAARGSQQVEAEAERDARFAASDAANGWQWYPTINDDQTIGSMLRIRLPKDYQVQLQAGEGLSIDDVNRARDMLTRNNDLTDMPPMPLGDDLPIDPIERHDDGLCTRWLARYFVGTDQVTLRIDAVVGHDLRVPERGHLPVTNRQKRLVIEHWSRAIDQVCAFARANPGSQHHVDINLTLMLAAGSALNPRINERRIEASNRSLELLDQWLTPEQRDSLARHGYFDLVGSNGGRYRLLKENIYNIRPIGKDGNLNHLKLCAVPEGTETLGDQLLAQKIALETDEISVVRVANAAPILHEIPTAG